MIVPSEELSFAWDHRTKPSTCVILHGDKVVLRGNYEMVHDLFERSQFHKRTNIEYAENFQPLPEKD